MPELPTFTIFPLGDSALTIDFGNSIDQAINQKVLALFHSFTENPIPDTIEIVPAYSSLTVYYDMLAVSKRSHATTIYAMMVAILEQRLKEPISEKNLPAKRLDIPVCYDPEFALDMNELAAEKNLNPEKIIELHLSKSYNVYMLGFLPGFCYMGTVDDQLAMSRKINPRQRVEAGSVGIAGHQTGIYPLASPGGWQIIGRTPLKLFDAGNKELTLLKPGDTVQFYSISRNEFSNY